jgi:hypothetical protein
MLEDRKLYFVSTSIEANSLFKRFEVAKWFSDSKVFVTFNCSLIYPDKITEIRGPLSPSNTPVVQP